MVYSRLRPLQMVLDSTCANSHTRRPQYGHRVYPLPLYEKQKVLPYHSRVVLLCLPPRQKAGRMGGAAGLAMLPLILEQQHLPMQLLPVAVRAAALKR